MIFSKLLGRRGPTPSKLYNGIVAQSRQPRLYTDYGIQDDVNGRFDMVCLHMVLVLTRLTKDETQDANFNQHLIDLFFADMDRSLREMGVGDLSVGKKVRKMSEVFYGLGTVLHPLLRGESSEKGETLEVVLDRNFYDAKNMDMAAHLAGYARAQFSQLEKADLEKLHAGEIAFSAPEIVA